MNNTTINHLELFSYYRIERISADYLRMLLAQLLETWLDQGDSMVFLQLGKSEASALAQAYHDLLIGYKHPRRDSYSWQYLVNDPTLARLRARFPELRLNKLLPSRYEKNLNEK